MTLSGNATNLFGDGDLSQHLATLLGQMKAEVKAEDPQKLLNVNETQYVEYLIQRYSVTVPGVYPEGMTASQSERPIPAEWHSAAYSPEPGRSYPRQVVTFHLPFSGDVGLLRLRPSSWSSVIDKAGVDTRSSTLNFDHVVWQGGGEAIKREQDQINARTLSMLANVANDVDRHNRTIQAQAPETVRARKAQLLQQANLVASLGVPLRTANDVPATFSVPVAKARPIIRKPDAPTRPFAPEPTLDPDVYRAILEHCRNVGREMERHPDLYRGRGEEALRDQFLLMLSPHFQSVSAETFNRKGKTDILVRHDKANVFVAECKFWGGAKVFLATIDQALSYLTWRDSKAAILCFNAKQQHAPVLTEIQKQAPLHPCFVKEIKGRSRRAGMTTSSTCPTTPPAAFSWRCCVFIYRTSHKHPSPPRS